MVRYCFVLLMVFQAVDLSGNVTDAQNQTSLGSSLAVCYLQNIKKQRNDYPYKDRTIEQIIFGKERESASDGTSFSAARASFHDVTLSVERKKSHHKSEITLTARVVGAPEEFEGKNVLDSEKALLKHRIISAYLAHKSKTDERWFAWLRSDAMVDGNTQITAAPTNLSDAVFMPYYARRVYTDIYEMTIVTTFTASDFDALIQKRLG